MDDEDYKKTQKELQDAVEGLRIAQNEASRSKEVIPEPPFCSFCGMCHNEVGKLMAGNGAYICNECIEAAKRVFDEENSDSVHGI